MLTPPLPLLEWGAFMAGKHLGHCWGRKCQMCCGVCVWVWLVVGIVWGGGGLVLVWLALFGCEWF